MSFESSFTLCPSNGGAFATYAGDVRQETTAKGAVAEGVGANSKDGECLSAKVIEPPAMELKQGDKQQQQRVQQQPQQQQTVLPGTLLQDWTFPSSNKASLRHPATTRSIRALPFEPLVYQRNLPKNGIISPLFVKEHLSSEASPKSPSQQPHHIPAAASSGAQASDNPSDPEEEDPITLAPPVPEIRIPTPQTLQQGKSDANKHDDDGSSCELSAQDYKTLYLCCQHDLYSVQQQAAAASEENRMLKRHVIQLLRQLNILRRNKRDAAWTVPETNHNKRRRGSTTGL